MLPEWDDSMSDGCSIPVHLKRFLEETPEMRACCVKHDKKYYYGGTIRDRAIADAEFLIDLLKARVNVHVADQMYMAVRAGGHPSQGRSFSWAFGGKRFKYDEEIEFNGKLPP